MASIVMAAIEAERLVCTAFRAAGQGDSSIHPRPCLALGRAFKPGTRTRRLRYRDAQGGAPYDCLAYSFTRRSDLAGLNDLIIAHWRHEKVVISLYTLTVPHAIDAQRAPVHSSRHGALLRLCEVICDFCRFSRRDNERLAFAGAITQ